MILKDLRKDRKMSQADVAKAIGVKVTTVSGWENRYFKPSFDNLIKLSNLFKTKIDKIANGLKDAAA
jgi:transcriptional regulator with XRE-family HTH domain